MQATQQLTRAKPMRQITYRSNSHRSSTQCQHKLQRNQSIGITYSASPDWEREREIERDRERERQIDRERELERDRDHERDREREREIEKDREREREREKERRR